MISLDVWKRNELRILCIGAHADDIEIGCGGTLLRILEENPGTTLHWAVFSANAERAAEARASAADYFSGAKAGSIELFDFRESYLPWNGALVKERFASLSAFAPDVVFSHFLRDRHQDHRLLAELTWNTFRNHLVLEYEIAKYEGDLETPNLYVPLRPEVVARKLELLERHFGTQRSKQWFDDELFRGMLRIRGVECASPTRYAEAFHARKVVL